MTQQEIMEFLEPTAKRLIEHPPKAIAVVSVDSEGNIYTDHSECSVIDFFAFAGNLNYFGNRLMDELTEDTEGE